MKYLLTLVFAFVFTLGFAQQQEERKISSFKYVKTGQAIDVILQKGSEEKARIIAKNVDLDEVITEVSGDKLIIKLKKGSYRYIEVKVFVTYTQLHGIFASSASSVTGKDQIAANKLEIGVSSAASIELDIKAEEVHLSASSSGDIDISGTANKAMGKASSAGDIDAYGLAVNYAELKVSSAGDIRMTVNKEIRAKASSGGSIRYKGNPDMSETDSSSGGSVKRH